MSQGPLQDHKLNRLHQGTARLVIGSLPVSYTETNSPPEESINALITGFTIPGFDLEYEMQFHYKGIVHIPVSEDNSYKGKILAVNVISDDRQENYWALYRYMETIRSGQTGGYPIHDIKGRTYGKDGFYRNRLTYIPRVDIVIPHKNIKMHQRMVFHRCYPAAISEMSVNFNENTPVTFNISFVFGMHTIERYPAPQENTTPMSVLD